MADIPTVPGIPLANSGYFFSSDAAKLLLPLVNSSNVVPYQLLLSPRPTRSFCNIAVVHSKTCISTITAETISLAVLMDTVVLAHHRYNCAPSSK